MKADKAKGVLIVLSGPSGVGKGTVCKALLARNPQVKLSVSATTRAPRPGEMEGVSYFFKTRDEFERMIAAGDFLEYMDVFGMNYYGTPRAYVEQQLAAGNDILLEIDVKGALLPRLWTRSKNGWLAAARKRKRRLNAARGKRLRK